ncbi:hypothetical protein HZH66_004130 [Vespula vulgaris]|uniref:Uncharacterized protein n=1 Tax=Vespula vulgaris TaxID=7454 RepID=A0A834KI56_VESVU|nr:hypothetical protein HZH66_004130 [Vespula vulgaris]
MGKDGKNNDEYKHSDKSHQRRFHLESETTWAIFFLPSFQQAFRQLAFRGVRSPINSREFASTKRKKIEDVRGFSFDLKPDILTYRDIEKATLSFNFTKEIQREEIKKKKEETNALEK